MRAVETGTEGKFRIMEGSLGGSLRHRGQVQGRGGQFWRQVGALRALGTCAWGRGLQASRQGRQFWRQSGAWRAVGADIQAVEGNLGGNLGGNSWRPEGSRWRQYGSWRQSGKQSGSWGAADGGSMGQWGQPEGSLRLQGSIGEGMCAVFYNKCSIL